MRREVTRDRLKLFMQALAWEAPRRGTFKVYLVGGGTAVYVAGKLKSLVSAIPESAYARYQNLSKRAVESAVRDFLNLGS